MKTVSFYLLLVGLCLTQLSLQANDVKTETRNTGAFTSITSNCSADILLTQGATTLVKVEADEDVLAKVITQVDNGVLKVSIKGMIRNVKVLRVHITVPVIEAIQLNGSGDLLGMSMINASNLELGIYGSGDMDLDLNAAGVKATISGSGDMKLAGIRSSLKLEVNGSGDFLGKNLQVELAEISNHGSGDIRLSGTALTTKIKSASSGDIHTAALKSAAVTTHCTGSADIHVYAVESLEVNSYSSGDIYYTGEPKTKKISLKGSGELYKSN
jgi:hypothetical protein